MQTVFYVVDNIYEYNLIISIRYGLAKVILTTSMREAMILPAFGTLHSVLITAKTAAKTLNFSLLDFSIYDAKIQEFIIDF